MKTFALALAALVMTGPLFASAADSSATPTKDVLTCVTSNDPQAQIKMVLTVQQDANADFIILTVADKAQTFRMFNQTTKGDVEAKIAAGGFLYMLLDENFSQDAGVVRNAGVIVVNRGDDGALSGLLMAHSNIYQLNCAAK